MKVTAIIAEYNPFHLGHKYHIEQARKLTNADIVVVIMSGNFVQRGEPAMFDKHLRAKVAVSCGADMILELPFPYSCSSAEYFAESAVTILDKLGCIDYLCFGSECDNVDDLYTIAKILIDEPDEFKNSLKAQLKEGLSYPKARQIALMSILKDSKYEDMLSMPNNILAIEYIKSLIKLNSNIKPIGVKRIISDYHHKNNNNPYYSASSIRNDYNSGSIKLEELSSISTLYNESSLYPVNINDFSTILGYKLMDNSLQSSDRIANNIDKYTNISNFVDILKTKNINYSTISRSLCHIMFDITEDDINNYRAEGYADYARVLAFNDNAFPIFKATLASNKIKLITKLTKANDILSDLPLYNKKIFDKTMMVDDVYRMVVQNKYSVNLPNEFRHKIH